MKLVVQRVSEAYVALDGSPTGSIGRGLVVFLCVEKGDDRALADHYASKIVEMRIFNDEEGKMNRSIKEVGGEILLISQFTLAADAEKGRRPSFDRAERPEIAEELYRYFARKVDYEGVPVVMGVFAAHMKIGLVNDGPVTIILGKDYARKVQEDLK